MSLQGEAGEVGRPQFFLRLGGCPLRCAYCDTPRSWTRRPRWERHGLAGSVFLPNPVSGEQLSGELEKLAREHGVAACELTLAVTGGEPLEQTDFLEAWLPRWPGRILLETAGLWPDRLERLLPHVDVVSLDWKLAGTLEPGRERVDPCECARRFGESGIEGWVKVVVSEETSDQELDRALARLSSAAPGVRTFLQPVTSAGRGPAAPPPERLLQWVIRNRRRALDLRVLPQVHPLLGLH